jgi:small subunit ribosomal protein S8
MVSDPISDLLTRIRNATLVRKPTVECPSSKLKIEICKILQKEGFIKKFVVVDDGRQGLIKILLSYKGSVSSIQGLRRVSTPGRRFYTQTKTLPKVLNGLGISIISTSTGLLTDKEARKANKGGEILCQVW